MTIPTFTGYDTALRGLEAEQIAIDTTGQNIDNASTPGYSRETVDLSASAPLALQAQSSVNSGAVNLGTGVDATTINRVRNQFLDIQYRAQNSALGNANEMVTSLTQAQASFNEPGANGLSAAMTSFYNAWGNLANAPTSAAAGESLVDNAKSLASQFNSLYSQLQTVQTQAGTQLSDLTASNGQLASDANQIAQLNGEINQQLGAGQNPNTLEDQRDSLIDDMSSLGTVSVTDPGNGLLQITFGGNATPLVDGTTVNWPPPAPTAATGGELGALASLSDTTANGAISPYLTQLNTVATDLISTVNGITDAASSATPYNFFSGTGASNIAVAAGVSAATVTTTGDNSVALAVSEIPGSAADTPDSTYNALIAQVGSDVKSATNTQTNTQALVNAVESQRESVSGVSIDEEMTNLLTYQRGYEAAAKALNTLDSVLSTLIQQV
jgi:flagellar hook-associated protein 1 FlgK